MILEGGKQAIRKSKQIVSNLVFSWSLLCPEKYSEVLHLTRSRSRIGKLHLEAKKNFFNIFSVVKKSKEYYFVTRKNDTELKCPIQNTVLLQHSPANSFSHGFFLLNSRVVVATECTWPASLKYLLSSPLQRKCADLYSESLLRICLTLRVSWSGDQQIILLKSITNNHCSVKVFLFISRGWGCVCVCVCS